MENFIPVLVVTSLCPLAAIGILCWKKAVTKDSATYFNYVTMPSIGLVLIGPLYFFMCWFKNEPPFPLDTPFLALLGGWFISVILLAYAFKTER